MHQNNFFFNFWDQILKRFENIKKNLTKNNSKFEETRFAPRFQMGSLWLNKGKVDLYVGNETRVDALTIPSGLILELDNCYFILVFFKNIVSIF